MNNKLFLKYLDYLCVEKKAPSLNYLEELITAQLTKFPFENISKIIFFYEQCLKGIVNLETYVNNSIEYGYGGTCYTNNYYFNLLMNYLGYNVSLHGADMDILKNVHIVSFVEINNAKYLVDVGYGAPFFRPILLQKNNTVSITWGKLEYVLKFENDNRPKITVFKRGNVVHKYIVNLKERKVDYFNDKIIHSYRNEAEFMNNLRIVRFFNDYSAEIKNFSFTENRNGKSVSGRLNNIDELKKIVSEKMRLPKLPIEKAYNLLTDEKGIDLHTK